MAHNLLAQTTDVVKPGQLSCFRSLERIAKQLLLIKPHMYSSSPVLVQSHLALFSGYRDSSEVLWHCSCRCCHVCAENRVSLCGIWIWKPVSKQFDISIFPLENRLFLFRAANWHLNLMNVEGQRFCFNQYISALFTWLEESSWLRIWLNWRTFLFEPKLDIAEHRARDYILLQ